MRTPTIVPRREAAVVALTLAGSLVATASPATAMDGPADTTTSPTTTAAADMPQTVLEVEQQKAARLAEQRFLKLTAHGVAPDNATAAVEAEQRQAAAEIRERILTLKLEGMTIDEIATTTPGLVVVSAPDNDPVPMSNEFDVALQRPSITFARQCSCYTVESDWEWDISEQERGNDGAGLRVTRTITQLGGSALVCDLITGCDAGGVTWEDPQGVVRRFSTRAGDYGTVLFSFKKKNGGCHQAYVHYAHAWEGEFRLNSVSIGTGGIEFEFERPDHEWNRQLAGATTGC